MSWATVDLALRHMLADLEECLDLAATAGRVGYSPYHFSRMVHRVTGIPLRSYLARLRVLRALRLLAHTGDPVTEVALAVGYSSMGTFSRVFRSHTGLSPSAYREVAAGRQAAPPPPSGQGSVRVTVDLPKQQQGAIYLGLFTRPDLAGFPLLEGVLESPGYVTLCGVPAGRSYAAAFAVTSPARYPGEVGQAWAVGTAEVEPGEHIILQLHERLPTSPPILALFRSRMLRNFGEAPAPGPDVRLDRANVFPIWGGATSMLRGIASALIYVREMDRSVDFYSKLLGAAPVDRDPTTAMFEVAGLRLVLHRDKLPSRAGVRGAMEFDLEVSDAGACVRELAARGIAATEPRRMPWGWTLVTVADPDGNIIELYEVPDRTGNAER